MGMNLSCCEATRPNCCAQDHDDHKGFTISTECFDISLIKKGPSKNKLAQQAMFMRSYEEGPPLLKPLARVRSTIDFAIARVLDDREVLGRVGFAKVELIEKLQALVRGSIVRRRVMVLKIATRLQKDVIALSQKLKEGKDHSGLVQ